MCQAIFPTANLPNLFAFANICAPPLQRLEAAASKSAAYRSHLHTHLHRNTAQSIAYNILQPLQLQHSPGRLLVQWHGAPQFKLSAIKLHLS